MRKCAVLLKDLRPAEGHLHHPWLHNGLQDLEVDFLGDCLTFLEEVCRHHVNVARHHPEDMN